MGGCKIRMYTYNNACVGSVKRACEAVGIDAEVRGPCGTGQRARVDERWQIATEFAECDHRRDTAGCVVVWWW